MAEEHTFLFEVPSFEAVLQSLDAAHTLCREWVEQADMLLELE